MFRLNGKQLHAQHIPLADLLANFRMASRDHSLWERRGSSHGVSHLCGFLSLLKLRTQFNTVLFLHTLQINSDEYDALTSLSHSNHMALLTIAFILRFLSMLVDHWAR